MEQAIDYDELDDALRRAGSTWEPAQAHGLLCSRLAAEGQGAGPSWLAQVLEGAAAASAARSECERLLDALYGDSYRQLAERLSEFRLVLPPEAASAAVRTAALAQWCEGFLHGLVTGQRDEAVRERLAAEPLADLIRDLLQITRAEADETEGIETNEQAYTELVEFVRVAAQVAYEELADLRDPRQTPRDEPGSLH